MALEKTNSAVTPSHFEAAASGEFPEHFECPITAQVMHDPVITPGGHSFERSAIEKWLRHKPSCPLTRAPLRVSQLRSNDALRTEILAHPVYQALHKQRRAEAAPSPAQVERQQIQWESRQEQREIEALRQQYAAPVRRPTPRPPVAGRRVGSTYYASLAPLPPPAFAYPVMPSRQTALALPLRHTVPSRPAASNLPVRPAVQASASRYVFIDLTINKRPPPLRNVAALRGPLPGSAPRTWKGPWSAYSAAWRGTF